jgi:putative tricarboxylic transport membrane protein
MSLTGMSADRVGGLIWVVFGVAIVYGSWTMDRLESLKIPLSTVPGVVPGLLGIGIIIFGLILLGRREASARAAVGPTFAATPEQGAAPTEEADGLHWQRTALSWTLCIVYGGLLLGHGLPYWVLTVAFLFLHILLLDETERVPAALSARRALIAAVIALGIATAVALVFRYVFLVRLP